MLITWYPPPIPGLGRDAAETPAGYLRQQWIRGAWRRGTWIDRLCFVAAIILWWPSTILHAAYLAIRLGPSRKRTSGKSPFRQFIEQIEVAARWMVPPLWYYTFEFHDDERRAHAADYLQRVQVKPFIYRWLIDRKQRRDLRVPFASKIYFSKLCRKHDLRASAVIATVAAKNIAYVDRAMTALPPIDLFVKIKLGRGGRGAEKWSYAAGTYRDAEGRSLTAAELAVHLKHRAKFEKRVIEACLVNHSSLADLNLGALATARILTARNEQGEIEATHAVFRMAQRPGAQVDNIHAGGIAAPVDLATGRLGRATDLGVRVDSAWHARHPVTGAQIEGRILPHWPAAVALVKDAHDRIGDRVAVGWDVAILEDGPCLIEGNGKPDVDLIQRPHRTGLGNSRFGALLAHHLKKGQAGDIRNGRRPEQLGTFNRKAP
jgi:hypothetical protein